MLKMVPRVRLVERGDRRLVQRALVQTRRVDVVDAGAAAVRRRADVVRRARVELAVRLDRLHEALGFRHAADELLRALPATADELRCARQHLLRRRGGPATGLAQGADRLGGAREAELARRAALLLDRVREPLPSLFEDLRR